MTCVLKIALDTLISLVTVHRDRIALAAPTNTVTVPTPYGQFGVVSWGLDSYEPSSRLLRLATYHSMSGA